MRSNHRHFSEPASNGARVVLPCKAPVLLPSGKESPMHEYSSSSWRTRLATRLSCLVLGLGLAGAHAQPVLTIEPITWNIIGLDSNDVTVGPNEFPVGARIRNIGSADAQNLSVTLELGGGSGVPYIGITEDDTDTSPSLAAGDAADFYFHVQIQRNAAAYDTTRAYRIAASAANHPIVRTPANRELYVEHLLSQNRNHVLQLVGPSNIKAGEIRTFVLYSATATNGYGQLETYVDFHNDVFEMENVVSSYTAGVSPRDTIYADACGWINDVTDPDYRSCSGAGKAGGDQITTYTVYVHKDLTGPLYLSTLIYDFSGSSYHYNSTYGIDLVIPPTLTDVAIVKSASQDPVEAGTAFQYFLTALNLSDTLAKDVVVSDTLPLGVSYLGATPPPTSGPDPLLWSVGDLQAGESRDFTIDVVSDCGTSGPVTNLATVSTITTETTLANNASSETVTVQDTQKPEITCPSDITVPAEAGQCDAAVEYTVTASDNCGKVTVESYPPSGSRFPVGTTDVVSTATDEAGNQATCTFKVTVTDTQKPEITCPDDAETTADVCETSAYVSIGTPQATDNCSDVAIGAGVRSDGLALTDPFPIGTTTVSWTATDGVGNQASCSISVRVYENSEPCHCNVTQGYWKNHPEAWPVQSLTLGTVSYTKTQLLRILNQPVNKNGLVALAHQLIAAKLNIAAGSDGSTIADVITAADNLIGNKVVPPIGKWSLKTNQTSGYVTWLDQFNRGLMGPPHCDDKEPVIYTAKRR